MTWRPAIGCAALVGGMLVTGIAAEAPAIGSLLGDLFGFDRAQIAQVQRGQPVAISMPGGLDREILAAGAVRVAAPASRVLDLFRDIESLESGSGFITTVRLSEPPRPDDFAQLTLPAADVQDLRRCRIGDCKLQLPRRGFELLAQVNWAAPDPEKALHALARQLAFDLVTAYRRGGAEAIGPTLEERPPRDTAAEFAQMMADKPFLERAVPGLSSLLAHYPRGPRPDHIEETFYWSLVEFGLKKTIRLNHIVIYPLPGTGRWVLANRQIWASHYFQTALEVRLLVEAPDAPTSSHYVVVLNLARPDGLTGIFGPIVRYKVRSGSREALRKTLGITKRLAETGRRRAGV